MHHQQFLTRSVARRLMMAACVAFTVSGSYSHGQLQASSARRTPIVLAVDACRDSVVNIHGHKTIGSDEVGTGDADGPRRVNGMGTGVIIDHRGFIITNYHVVQGVRRIQVTLADRRTYTARLVSHDHDTDLAVIKIDVKESLPLIPIGTSRDLMPGEPVIALGNAYGYHHTVTCGVISALDRSVQVSDDQRYHDLIQTDASINPGNSGGPLLNIDGEMIGINAAVRVGAQGIGFAIPVDRAMDIARSLLRSEHGHDLWRGLQGEMVVQNDERYYKVHSVRSDSYAAKAGVQGGDVIRSINGIDIRQDIDMERALLGVDTGESLSIALDRDNVPKDLSIVLGTAPQLRQKPSRDDKTWRVLGLRLSPVAANQLNRANSRCHGGLRVTAVRGDSPADDARIRTGDILVGVHVWETISLENISYILKQHELKQKSPVKFYIVRDDKFLFGHLPIVRR
jgi:serine protease Do